MNHGAMNDGSPSSLTEWDFVRHYREALRLRDQGHLIQARDRYLLLFDQGRGTAGYGVARLSFVLDDLRELLVELTPGETAPEVTLAPLFSRREGTAARLLTGEGGFIEAQALVALDRVLGQPDASRAVHEQLASGSGPQAAAHHTLGNLIWRDRISRQTDDLNDSAHQDPEHWPRVVGLARSVARAVGEHRMRTDFPGDDWVDRDRYLRWLGRRIERLGRIAFIHLLRLDGVEPPPSDPPMPAPLVLAQRLQDWLLAYRPDGEMRAMLIEMAEETEQDAVADRLRQGGVLGSVSESASS